MNQNNNDGLTGLGKLFVFLFVVACFYGAWYLFTDRGSSEPAGTSLGGRTHVASSDKVRVGIAYGTEKKRWLQWAVDRFAETSEGKKIEVDLIPRGSLEGAQEILRGEQSIHVWSPASALYTDVFVQEWELKYGKPPFVRQEVLALSPMVFVFWRQRHDAFQQHYGEVSFDTINRALAEPAGWKAIADKPEWGLFKFGHTHPNQSNSGLMSLVLAAYSHQNKTRNLELDDILDVQFQEWFQQLESGVSGLINSTGNMMRDMVLKGPSSYDAIFVYENVAIDYLENAEGRWGQLHVAYPEQNMWNDTPYYIIDAPWSSREQRRAAETFLDFLLTEEIQRQALEHGFRPGNPAVPIRFPESPFERYASYGLKVDLPSTCEPPKAEVVNNLLAAWQRSRGRR